jgi:hypothetical protein
MKTGPVLAGPLLASTVVLFAFTEGVAQEVGDVRTTATRFTRGWRSTPTPRSPRTAARNWASGWHDLDGGTGRFSGIRGTLLGGGGGSDSRSGTTDTWTEGEYWFEK